MKIPIEEIIETVQADLDRQSDGCNCFQSFGGANIEIRGGKMDKEEWRDFIEDIVELIKNKFDIEYELYSVFDGGGKICLTDRFYGELMNEQPDIKVTEEMKRQFDQFIQDKKEQKIGEKSEAEYEVLVAISIVAYSEEEAVAIATASLNKEIERDGTMTNFVILDHGLID